MQRDDRAERGSSDCRLFRLDLAPVAPVEGGSTYTPPSKHGVPCRTDSRPVGDGQKGHCAVRPETGYPACILEAGLQPAGSNLLATFLRSTTAWAFYGFRSLSKRRVRSRSHGIPFIAFGSFFLSVFCAELRMFGK